MTLSKEALKLKKEVELYSRLSNPYEKVLQAKRIQDKFDSVQEIVDKVIDEMEEKAGLPKGWVKQLATKSKEERTGSENSLDT